MTTQASDEEAVVKRVAENARCGRAQRVFPYQKGPGGFGRALRLQCSDGNTSPAEERLKAAADARRYDQIVCGLLSLRDQFEGSCVRSPLSQDRKQCG